MKFRNKVLLILGFCAIICLGSFFIIRTMFNNLEDQLFKKCRIEALTGAKVMGDIIEILIEHTSLTEEDVFAYSYRKIPGTNPPKYDTGYTPLFEKHLQRIQDEFLKDHDLIFAVLIDKNGYVPVHNSKYSKPPTGDYAVDLKFSRSKRNFSDSEAIQKVIAYTGDDVAKALYKRDTGENLWNMGAPVYINGKHWGTFLLGVSLERIDEIKNQMLLLTLAVMFVILSLTMLSILAVIPRSMLPADFN